MTKPDDPARRSSGTIDEPGLPRRGSATEGQRGVIDEQVTRPTPRQKRASSEQPTAHAPIWPSDGEHEAPTRAVGSNPPGVGIHDATTSAGPDPAIAPPRRWRASSEAPTSHSGTTTGEEPSTGRPSETTLKSPPRLEGARSPRGDQVAGTIRDRDAHEAPTVSSRDGRPVTNRAADVPMSTAPQSLPPPKKAPQVSSGPTPACPQCEAPMAWVEEHLRFYCASCRMYF